MGPWFEVAVVVGSAAYVLGGAWGYVIAFRWWREHRTRTTVERGG